MKCINFSRAKNACKYLLLPLWSYPVVIRRRQGTPWTPIHHRADIQRETAIHTPFHINLEKQIIMTLTCFRAVGGNWTTNKLCALNLVKTHT